MKSYSLKNWVYSNDLDCLLFFALRIRELVFDYTLDSFKYPALNTLTICKEALDLLKEIENENFSEKSIIPVLEELIFKISNDSIAKTILKGDLKYYINYGDYSDIKEIRIKIEILRNKLTTFKYFNEVKKILLEKIEENREKKLIYELSTSFINTLIVIGFHPTFIYKQIHDFFFEKNNIDSCDVLVDFFKAFENDSHEYTIIFKSSKIFEEIKSSVSSFNCEITDVIDSGTKDLDKGNFLFTKNKNQRFFLVKDIVALDAISAKNKAENRINKLAKLFVFFHHKNHPEWSKNALVIDENKDSFLIKESISPMEKRGNHQPKKAAIKLNALIKGIKLRPSSFSKYDRVIDLHGLSVQNKIIENQLLQNWIALETLLVGYSKAPKIDQVVEHLLPFVMHRYIRKQIDSLIGDLLRVDMKFFKNKITNVIEGSDVIEKFTALLVLDKYKPLRDDFYQRLEKSPLLKWRLSQFKSIFSDLNKTKQHVENHKRKVNWQIKRMYRSRNLIVHAGLVPSFTEMLVENSHTYLDLLIININHMCIKERSISTIEQAIKEMQIINRKNEKLLSTISSIDDENYINALL